MTEKNVTNESTKKSGWSGAAKTCVVLVIMLVVVMFMTFSLYMQLRDAGNKINKIENARIESAMKVAELSKLNEITKTKMEASATELEKIKKRVEDIKTLDDLLERDIKLYIKSHYRKVPTSVAAYIAKQIIENGKKYNIPPILMVGIMQVESGFNPMITGPKTKYGHARGLMQVMPEWVKKLGLESTYDLYDIDKNIVAGCKVFNIHLEEGKGKISEGLYRYVNQDKKYVTDVYTAMGKFVAFRSTVETGKDEVEPIPENGKEENAPDEGTEQSPKRDNGPAEQE